MASFAKENFAADQYSAWRPSYPLALYEGIFDYHDGPSRVALDLGTGHGLVARQLAPTFDRVIGTDMSELMIREACKITTESNVEFRQSKAESSPFLQDNEVDLVTAATCAHWFDYPTLWPEMARVVRPGGTLAFWAYKTHMLVDYPAATRVMEEYFNCMDETLLGPYWPQPGHDILSDYLHACEPPEDDWEEVERYEYHPGGEGAKSGKGLKLMSGKMTLGSMAAYIRTWSTYIEWQARWPDRKPRSIAGGVGDVIDEMLDEMCEVEPALAKEAASCGLHDVEVSIEYGSVVILAKRKET